MNRDEIVKTDRIRTLSKEKGISLSFICRKLEVAPVYFIDIDKSGRDIPDDKLSIIADILDTTPEYLRGETDVKEKPDGSTTTIRPDEMKLITEFRKLSPEMQDFILSSVRAQTEKLEKGQKK